MEDELRKPKLQLRFLVLRHGLLGVTLTAKHGTVRPLNWRFQRCQRYDRSPVDAHATLLSNGNVLIAGGFYLNSAEVYNRNRSVQGDGSDAVSPA